MTYVPHSIYSLAELKACALREVEMRRRVYPKWVAQDKMTSAKALDEISKMTAIAELLDDLAQPGAPSNG